MVRCTKHHPIHYTLYTNRLGIGGSAFIESTNIPVMCGIFCQEPAISSQVPGGADYILGSLNLNTIINVLQKDIGYYVLPDHGEELL